MLALLQGPLMNGLDSACPCAHTIRCFPIQILSVRGARYPARSWLGRVVLQLIPRGANQIKPLPFRDFPLQNHNGVRALFDLLFCMPLDFVKCLMGRLETMVVMVLRDHGYRKLI
jgi:hypothetical protein